MRLHDQREPLERGPGVIWECWKGTSTGNLLHPYYCSKSWQKQDQLLKREPRWKRWWWPSSSTGEEIARRNAISRRNRLRPQIWEEEEPGPSTTCALRTLWAYQSQHLWDSLCRPVQYPVLTKIRNAFIPVTLNWDGRKTGTEMGLVSPTSPGGSLLGKTHSVVSPFQLE